MRFEVAGRTLASPLWMGWQHDMNLVGAPGGKAFWKDRAYMFGENSAVTSKTIFEKGSPIPTQSRWALLLSVNPPSRSC